MKIIVCLKQVPKNDSVLRINEQGTWIQERDLTYEINESDQYALEAALQLKEKHGGEVIALSLGPQRVQTVIKEALARGADRGLHLEDAAFDGLDDDGAIQGRPRLPGQQFGFGFGPFFQQGFDVALAPLKTRHIVGEKTGKDVFAHERVNRETRVGQGWFGCLRHDGGNANQKKDDFGKTLHRLLLSNWC